MQGDYGIALESFQNSLDLGVTRPSAYRGLGWSYFFNKKYEEAVENFEKAKKKALKVLTYTGVLDGRI
ncbi:MAG: tetratricopeptide repeat protein [Nanoarchaeota archaeon]